MKALTSGWIATLLVLLSVTSALSQDARLTGSQMRAQGIETARLQPITFSHDNRTLAAFDRAPFEEKKKGTFFRLWFFEIERDGSFGKIRSVDLPLKNLLQGEFAPDDSKFVVLGNRGTTFLSVDMETLELRPIMKPVWGVEGFKADPPVLWTERGRLFVTGVPYDKERFIETRTVATIDPNKVGREAFERGRNISSLEKSLERLWFANYVSDEAAFFGQQYPGTTLLSYWNGEDVREFDRAWKYIGFWGNAGRLLYAARPTENADCELTLYDASSDSKKLLGSSPQNYKYLFLSRDGETLIASQLAEGRRLIPYFAKEEDDWELKPLGGTDSNGNPRSLPAGWMRLSSDGSYLCHLGSTGMTLFILDN